jgi:hypothetical protein
MATQYSEFIRNILLRLERDDGKARLAVEQAVNEAVLVIALLFDVAELVTTANATALVSSTNFTLPTDPLVFDVLKVRNTVTNKDMGFIPLDLIDIVTPANLAPRYWSRAGNKIQFRGEAAANQAFELTVKAFPTALSNSSDPCLYEGHDSEVIALATTLAAAVLNEKEKFDYWKGMLGELQVPYSKVEIARTQIQGMRTGTAKVTTAEKKE